MVIDFQPPSIATWLTLAYTTRSDSAARLLISRISPWSVVADHRQIVEVLGVVLVEHAARVEGVEDAVAEHVAQFVVVHPAVQPERSDDVDVVDAGLGGEVEHGFDDALTVVGSAHLGQRQARVVEHDRELHVGAEERRERLHVDRVEQRVADLAVEVVEARQRLGWVDHPAAVGGELLEAEPFAPPEQDGGRRAVDVEHESGAWHQAVFLMSKAILVAPRRPAAAAWAMASTWSSSR